MTSKKLPPLNPDKQIDPTLSSSNRTELLGNPTTAHHLFISAIKRARQERQQVKLRQKTSVIPKKKLTIKDIDRLFEEKCFRPTSIRMDLLDLYHKSPYRIQSMLDLRQIDQFIQISDNRKKNPGQTESDH